MRQRLLIALLTILVLGAGYFAGVWTERHSCKVPPAPQLLGELSPAKRATAAKTESPAPNPAELAAQIAQLRPEIEKFRERMVEIDREMDRDIDAILRPAQRELFKALIKRYADLRTNEDAALNLPTPLTTEEIIQLQQKPLYKMLAIVVVPMRVEWNTRDLKLDEAQREQLRDILRHRRDKFIALVDSSPPPSLTLSRLAPIAQRLTEPAK
jgi:Spy/CpxP family protein refolding chaperone